MSTQTQPPAKQNEIVKIEPDQPVFNIQTLARFLGASKNRFHGLTTESYTLDRITRVAMTACQRTPSLLACTSGSLIDAIVRSAELRLECSGATGQAYLVPFRDKGTRKAQLIIGYRGMIDLATRDRRVLSIQSRAVFKNEPFEIRYGTRDRIIHRPTTAPDRGELIGVYAVGKMAGGVTQFDFMSVADIDEVRERSRAKADGPWQTDAIEMAKKTVVRRFCKNLPFSIDDSDYDTAAPLIPEEPLPAVGSAVNLNDLPEPTVTVTSVSAPPPAEDVHDAEFVETAAPAARAVRSTQRKADAAPAPAPVATPTATEAPKVEPAPKAAEKPAEEAPPADWTAFENAMWQIADAAKIPDTVRAEALSTLQEVETDDGKRAPDPARMATIVAAARAGRFSWDDAVIEDQGEVPVPNLADDATFRTFWDAASTAMTLDVELGWSLFAVLAKRRKLAVRGMSAADRRSILEEYAAWTPDKVKQVKDKSEENRRKAEADRAAKAAAAQQPAAPAPAPAPAPAAPPAEETITRESFVQRMKEIARGKVAEDVVIAAIEAWELAAPVPANFIESADYADCLKDAREGRFSWSTGEQLSAG